ncbi:NINE protein [Chamaesiphon sp. OTE_20_metabat_361]|uniref:NINE protein n=1 Tax=Chamaesiphon sp. OTE_20_metabat_361 TaxID=2964689 RepID=UPI00286A3CEA|nr:NINE protein [Chamaesiphon sp. OTE_20_metabat_361]
MRNRTAAILICFFGGSFGVHKFYLGNPVLGILYLVFCWTFIPGLISFFEFLGLCFMSDREFDARFNYAEDPNLLAQSSRYPIGSARSRQEATSTLYDLKKLYEDGIITAEEYEVKRRKMLDDI